MNSKTEETGVAQLLAFAKKMAKTAKTGDALHNAVFGIDGQMAKVFPNQAERARFANSTEFAQISELIDSLPTEDDKDGPSGQFRLRIPQSMHKALVAEAERENVSLNTLCVVKLAASLKSVVR